LGGGHYTAYAQNFVDGQWYYFDGMCPLLLSLGLLLMICVDSSVRAAKEDDVVTSAAYLLFYRRRSETPLGGNTSKLIEEYIANTAKAPSPEESDSTTASPKPELVVPRSSSSSPPSTKLTLKPFASGIIDSQAIADVYAPLTKKRDNVIGATSWKGGWSNRASSSYVNPSSALSFSFGMSGYNQTTDESSSGEFDSRNRTPSEANAATPNNDDDIEVVEQIPVDLSEDPDDVQVIKIDSTDGTEGDRTA